MKVGTGQRTLGSLQEPSWTDVLRTITQVPASAYLAQKVFLLRPSWHQTRIPHLPSELQRDSLTPSGPAICLSVCGQLGPWRILGAQVLQPFATSWLSRVHHQACAFVARSVSALATGCKMGALEFRTRMVTKTRCWPALNDPWANQHFDAFIFASRYDRRETNPNRI